MSKQAQLKKGNEDLFLNIYKIGDIYITTNSENPADRFGGQWEQIKDKFLLCAGNSYGAGTSGGSTSHTHTTGNHTLTINEMPNHGHRAGSTNGSAVSGRSLYPFQMITSANNLVDINVIESTGGGEAHNHGNTGSSSNIPPYLAVYVWKRIA